MARKSRNAPTVNRPESENVQFRAGIYTRLSVEDGDDEQNNSLGNQQKICLSYIDSHADIVLTAAYSDNGYTGMNYTRPDFNRLMDDIRSGRVNCVIVKDVSRLGRSFIMTSELVERTLPSLGVRLICVNDGYDSASESADASALTLPLKMVMNEFYVHDISQKIRSGIDAKMKSGEYLPSASSIPYGYLRNSEAVTYDIDAETAPTVRRIYELRCEGRNLSDIAKRLNEAGIPSPGKLRYLRGMTRSEKFRDALWVRGTVRKILEDPVYTGRRTHRTVNREKLGRKKRRTAESDWLVIENCHPAIVSRELFERVQSINAQVLTERSSFTRRNDAATDYRTLFRGKVFCADCGSKMGAAKGCARPNAKTPSRIFFDCNSYRYSSHERCSSHYIRQEKLMELVKKALDRQVELSVDVEQLADSIKRSPATLGRRRAIKEQLDRVAAKRRAMEAKLQRLLEDMADGLLDVEEYRLIKAKYDAEYNELVESEALMGASAQELDTSLQAVNKWLDSLRRYKELPELSRDLLDELVERIEVTANRDVRVILNCADPFAPLLKFACLDEVMPDAG